MTHQSNALRVLAATALLVNVGCGGSSSDSGSVVEPNEAGINEPVADGNDTVGVASEVQGDVGVGAGINTSFDTPAVAGKGMPFLYQNGYKVDAIIRTSASGRVSTFEFTTNTDDNTITESGNTRDFHEYRYDDVTGRVTEFGVIIVSATATAGLPHEVFYNDDGTISGYILTPVGGSVRPYNKITYSNGLRQTHVNGRFDETGVPSESLSMIYNYSPSNELLSSRRVSSVDGDVTDNGYDYTVNVDGLVTSAQRLNVDDFDIQFSPERLYFTYEYDENNNMVKFQNFTNEGELIRTVEITYSPTTEPTPNIAGFMMIRGAGYQQIFDGY